MPFRYRHRLLAALIVIGSLLFQQVAVAAYACELPARTQPPAPTDHCMHAEEAPAPQAPSPLCDKHCSPDLSVLANTAALAVPSLGLPPLVFTPVLNEPAAPLALADPAPFGRSELPPRLRYCTLLI